MPSKAKKNSKKEEEASLPPPPPGTAWAFPFGPGAPPIPVPAAFVQNSQNAATGAARSPDAAWSPAGPAARTGSPEARTSMEEAKEQQAMDAFLRPAQVLAQGTVELATLPFRAMVAPSEEKDEGDEKKGGKSGVQKEKFRGAY